MRVLIWIFHSLLRWFWQLLRVNVHRGLHVLEGEKKRFISVVLAVLSCSEYVKFYHVFNSSKSFRWVYIERSELIWFSACTMCRSVTTRCKHCGADMGVTDFKFCNQPDCNFVEDVYEYNGDCGECTTPTKLSEESTTPCDTWRNVSPEKKPWSFGTTKSSQREISLKSYIFFLCFFFVWSDGGLSVIVEHTFYEEVSWCSLFVGGTGYSFWRVFSKSFRVENILSTSVSVLIYKWIWFHYFRPVGCTCRFHFIYNWRTVVGFTYHE